VKNDDRKEIISPSLSTSFSTNNTVIKLQELGHMGDLDEDGRVILNWIIKKFCVWMWDVVISFRIGYSVGPL
jgi:hypothetical protein